MKPKKYDPWTALVLPYEFGPDRNSLGPQTILRLERLVEAVRCDGYNIPRVLLTAGFPPWHRVGSPPERPFADMMYEWLMENRKFSPDQIVGSSNTRVWTSWGEIREAVHLIEEKDLPRNILVVTTWNHAYPRLWLIWHILLLFRCGWHVRFAVTKKCRVGFMHEVGGVVKDVPFSILARLRA